MHRFRQYHRLIILSLPWLVACGKKTEPSSKMEESPGMAFSLPDSAISDPTPCASDSIMAEATTAQAPLPIPHKARKKQKPDKHGKDSKPLIVVVETTSPDSLPTFQPTSLPMLPEELMSYVLRLYREADSLIESEPNLAMTKVNLALRYCDDGALYTLAARIICAEGDIYKCQVLSERGYLKASYLNTDAHAKSLRLLIQALRKMREESPSSNIESKYNHAVLAYQLRYQKPPEDR